jgi:undecaprenyl-diphosphatase
MAAVSVCAAPGFLVALFSPLILRRRREAGALLAVAILSTLLSVGLQFLLARPRPADVRRVLSAQAFPSFPSGHAACAFGCALLAGRFWRRGRWAFLLGALVVSISRIYLGQHYPSDVLGGAILGMGTAGVVYGVVSRGHGDGRPRWAWLVWGQLALVALAAMSASLGLLDMEFLEWPAVDKVLHILLYGLLAFLSVAWWVGRPPRVVLLRLAGLALADELVQSLSPFRAFDWFDLAASLGGVVLWGCLGNWVAGRERKG